MILHLFNLKLGEGDQANKGHYPLGKKTLFLHPPLPGSVLSCHHIERACHLREKSIEGGKTKNMFNKMRDSFLNALFK